MSYQTINAQQAHSMMTSGAPLHIIDVRAPHEYAAGHIKGAINVPLPHIRAGRTPFAMADKNATYLVYCRTGNRSSTAASILASKGWKAIYDMGGLADWPYDVVK